jgi:hypothetical protein
MKSVILYEREDEVLYYMSVEMTSVILYEREDEECYII